MTAGTPTLPNFLLARIEEREAVALDAQGTGNGWWTDGDGEVWAHMQMVCHPTMVSHAAHIALNHPAQILAECEAKRRIVEEALSARFVAFDPDSTLGDKFLDEFAQGVLSLLALPYADHPDYNPDWRP